MGAAAAAAGSTAATSTLVGTVAGVVAAEAATVVIVAVAATVATGASAVEAAADMRMQGEIYSYSRSKGAFAGISLKGTLIEENKDANHTYYGQTPIRDILMNGKVKKLPQSAKRFIKGINLIARAKGKGAKK